MHGDLHWKAPQRTKRINSQGPVSLNQLNNCISVNSHWFAVRSRGAPRLGHGTVKRKIPQISKPAGSFYPRLYLPRPCWAMIHCPCDLPRRTPALYALRITLLLTTSFLEPHIFSSCGPCCEKTHLSKDRFLSCGRLWHPTGRPPPASIRMD